MSALCEVHAHEGRDAFTKTKDLWLEVVARRPGEAAVLRSASKFFRSADEVTCEALLRRGAELEPGDAGWRVDLADHAIRVASREKDPDGRVQRGRHAIEECEVALAVASSPGHKHRALVMAAKAALVANDAELSARYAERIVAQADEPIPWWLRGNAVHYGHIALGHAALARGDVGSACDHLAAASAVRGSPSLHSFGPDQELAAELLACGERDAVIAYAEACKKFYGGGLGLLGAAYRDAGIGLRVVK